MRSIFASLGLGLLTACGGTTSDVPVSMDPPLMLDRPEAPSDVSFATLLNSVRLDNGAAGVGYDSRLGAAAQNHASDMLAQNYFSHTGLNGSTVVDRVEATGYAWKALGENIAQGQTSQAEVLTAWTNSPPHHANDINPTYEDFGLGTAGGGSATRWVLVLGRD